jgi:membrane protein YqaA with SNARE-associated domain
MLINHRDQGHPESPGRSPIRPWQRWLLSWNDRPHGRALVKRLAPFADHRAFPLLGGILAFGATITMSLPLAPVVSALVVLKPSRWRAIASCAVLGSASGAAALTYAFEILSLPLLNARMPELMNSRHWLHLVDWASRSGWWVLAGVAASPISQTPALVLAAMLEMPLWHVFLAVAVGKSVKYSLIARVTQVVVTRAMQVNDTDHHV